MAGVTTLIAAGAVFLASKLHRPDAGLNDAEITIDRPAAQVWAWFTDLDRVKQWVGGLEEARSTTVVPEGGLRRGARMRMTMRIEGEKTELDEEVAVVEPNKRLGLRLRSAEGTPLAFTEFADWTFHDADGTGEKTTVRGVARSKYFGVAALMEPWITPAAEKKVTEDLVRLKMLVEGEARHASRD
jgi:uncharacterized protein YndB with AHSA1/START domain